MFVFLNEKKTTYEVKTDFLLIYFFSLIHFLETKKSPSASNWLVAALGHRDSYCYVLMWQLWIQSLCPAAAFCRVSMFLLCPSLFLPKYFVIRPTHRDKHM